jgi:hypothetical protein
MIQSPKPIPRVSAKHYAPQPVPTAAKVRFRVKGESDGPVYQGQVQIIPCASCGQKSKQI